MTQPDLIHGLPPINTNMEIEITDPKTLQFIHQLEGISAAMEAIAAEKSQLPGMKFALSCVNCLAHEARATIFTRFQRDTVKSGLDMNRYAVVGFRINADKKYIIKLKSFDLLDSEQPEKSELSESKTK